MRLLVDDKSVGLERQTLAAAIAAGAAHAESLGRIVVEIKADGVTLGEREIEGASDEPGASQEVAIETVSKSELGASVLEAAAAALTDLVASQRFVADQILATRLEPAMNALKGVLDVWQGVRAGTEQVCEMLATDLPSLGARAGKGAEAAAIVGRTTATLGEVMRSVQAQDWSTLADVMNDELSDLAGAWHQLLGAVAAALYADT